MYGKLNGKLKSFTNKCGNKDRDTDKKPKKEGNVEECIQTKGIKKRKNI